MKKIWIGVLALGSALPAAGQEGLDAKSFQGLELRGIGPALISGRVADIAIHPKRHLAAELDQLDEALEKAGAPWTKGRRP